MPEALSVIVSAGSSRGPSQFIATTAPSRHAPIDNFWYTANSNNVSTTGFELYAFNASLSTPGYDLQLCSKNIGMLGGYIVLHGTATAWGDATKSHRLGLTVQAFDAFNDRFSTHTSSELNDCRL